MLTKRESARCIRARTRTSRLDTVKKPNELIPLHPLRSLTVREHFHFSCCTFLIVPSDIAPTSAVPSHVLEENTDPNATANEKKSNWKSTASATGKLLLRGVRDSADAFGPLKAVAGGLCFILENYEVLSSSIRFHNTHRFHSKRRRTSKRWNRWHPVLKHLPNLSAYLFPRVISRSKKGERDWNGRLTPSKCRAQSHTR